MTNMQIAKTILQQIGGNRFVAMTGAKNMVAVEEGLTFRIPTANKINFVKITLNAMDTYDVEYGYIRGMDYTVRKNVDDLYFDQLASSFEKETGLYTSL